MCRRAAILMSLLMLLPLATLPLEAQEGQTVYVRVALWDVKREHWGNFVKFWEKHDQPTHERLFAEGVINEWGIDATGLHSPEGYTHATWHSATSLAAFEKVDDAFEKAISPEQAVRLDAELAGMLVKHKDLLLRVDYQRAKGVRLDKAFFQERSIRVKPGKGMDWEEAWKQNAMPTYKKLMDDGVVLAYGISRSHHVTDNPRERSWWFVVGDMAGLDKVSAAFEAAWGAMTEEQRAARRASMQEIVEPDSRRDFSSRIIHWAIKAQ
jgi:hypothetical protein